MIEMKCTECRSDISVATPSERFVKCPYCGAINELPLELVQEAVSGSVEKEAEKPVMVSFEPVAKTLDAVEQICSNELVNDELVPDNVFDEIIVKGQHLVYLPFCVAGGSYQLTSSYEEGGNKFTQHASGNIYKKVLLYRGSGMPTALRDRIDSKSPTSEKPLDFAADEDMLEHIKETSGAEVYVPDSKPQQHYSQLIEDAKQQFMAKHKNGSKFTFSNFAYQFDSDRMVYVPFYIVEMEYRGLPYYMAVCASTSTEVYSVLPVDEQRAQTFSKLKEPSAVSFLGCLPPIAVLLLWLFGPLSFWSMLLWMFIASIITCVVFGVDQTKKEKKKTQIIEESRRIRLQKQI